MRAAPAVDAALGQGRVERMLMAWLHAGSGAALAVWATAHAQARLGSLPAGLPWVAGLAGALALGATGAYLARRALPAGPARLCWDGSAWQLREGSHNDGPTPLMRVVVSLDLGAWMLLQLVPADGSTPLWRPASAHGVGAAWHGLKVALQAHAGEQPMAENAVAGRPGARP
jgi:hypothetical protein